MPVDNVTAKKKSGEKVKATSLLEKGKIHSSVLVNTKRKVLAEEIVLSNPETGSVVKLAEEPRGSKWSKKSDPVVQ